MSTTVEQLVQEAKRRIRSMSPEAVADTVLSGELVVIDVRNPGEVAAAPVAGARNIPLASVRRELATLDPSRPTVLLCAGGARSAIASSVPPRQ